MKCVSVAAALPGFPSLEFVKEDTLAGTVLTHLGGYVKIEFNRTR